MQPHRKAQQHCSSYALQFNSTNYAPTGPITSLQQQTCWRSNHMLQSSVERQKKQEQVFHRRTSFEQNLLNNHIKEMVLAVAATGLELELLGLPLNDKKFEGVRQCRQIAQIIGNFYLTEQEKWQMTEVILGCQQNFSILMRLSAAFRQNRQELCYLLCKILHFCTAKVEVEVGCKSKRQTLMELMGGNRMRLLDEVLGQEVVKVVGPKFFSNVNEQPLLRIVDGWFYHVLCVKQGLYGQGLGHDLQEETHFEEENYFQLPL